jgi:general secretion pathway protein G
MGLWTYGGNPYIYLVPSEDGQPFSLNSYGKDGVAGGTDEDQNVIY